MVRPACCSIRAMRPTWQQNWRGRRRIRMRCVTWARPHARNTNRNIRRSGTWKFCRLFIARPWQKRQQMILTTNNEQGLNMKRVLFITDRVMHYQMESYKAQKKQKPTQNNKQKLLSGQDARRAVGRVG